MTEQDLIKFVKHSELFDYMVTRPLWHILPNWELTWDDNTDHFIPEEDSFAEKVNEMLDELIVTPITDNYHDNEDILAEHVQQNLNWNIIKVHGWWISCDYQDVINQGSFGDEEQKNLLSAAKGRIETAIKHGQSNFDDMEYGHQRILAMVLASILYQRSNDIV
ncbi:hypothetical protein [uncultured Muribaculum sp.]|uniref:hypothetical protein n=1 Tax=uncultured Muribaculum sp. TaxID=1918613 RepID=UPI00259CE776|nr:hypothetical protein [uncultured Muribaculum sp.]